MCCLNCWVWSNLSQRRKILIQRPTSTVSACVRRRDQAARREKEAWEQSTLWSSRHTDGPEGGPDSGPWSKESYWDRSQDANMQMHSANEDTRPELWTLKSICFTLCWPKNISQWNHGPQRNHSDHLAKPLQALEGSGLMVVIRPSQLSPVSCAKAPSVSSLLHASMF